MVKKLLIALALVSCAAQAATLSESIAKVNAKHPYCIPEVIELATAQRLLNEDIAQYPGKTTTEQRLVYIFGCKRSHRFGG